MQKIIVQFCDTKKFEERVNEALNDGWRIIPESSLNTRVSTSTSGTMSTACSTICSIALEKD